MAVFDEHRLFESAAAFSEAAEKIGFPADKTLNIIKVSKMTGDEIKALFKEKGIPGKAKFAPMFALQAFATELYLKYLHVVDTGTHPTAGKEAHNLRFLFDGLPLLRQKQIRDNYEQWWVRDGQYALIPGILKKAGESVPDLTLDGILDGSANAFVEHRYIHQLSPNAVTCWALTTLYTTAQRVATDVFNERQKAAKK
jgi:hypothetical protein